MGTSPAGAPASSSLRIVHLLARSHRRGAELVAMELADELDGLGHRNQLVALGPALDGGHEPGLRPLSEAPGVGPVDLLRRARDARRLFDGTPVDVVVAHGGWAAQVAALGVPRHGPLLVWQRILGAPDSLWRPGRRQWWEWVVGRFDACVALTDDLEDEVRRLGFAGPVWVIPNARQPGRFEGLDRSAAEAELRAELGVGDDVPLIGFVGHLVAQKRPERALDVLARVRAAGTPAHLVMAGGGPLRQALEAEVARSGLEGAVTLLGHRDDVQVVLGGVEMLLLTSEAEGIPGVAIEALMAGCPVVTYPVGSVGEVVDDGLTGIVLAQADPAAMAAAVVGLLDDDATRARMSAAGRSQTERFSAASTAQTYSDRLTSLVDGVERGRAGARRRR